MSTSTKVFGVHLHEVMARPTERAIPTFIKNIIRFLNQNALDTEGIFRIAAKNNLVQDLKNKIDAGEEVDFGAVKDAHLIAGVLKVYFRELPEPLLTFELYPKFIAAATEFEQASKSNPDNDAANVGMYVETLANLVSMLPTPNRALAEILLLFLSRVGEHSNKNKMTPSNLGIVFGQLLLRPEVETIESMMNASKITAVMRFMIEKFEQVFPKQKKTNRPVSSIQEVATSRDGSGAQMSEEEEKLQKIKETVDEAIVLIQRKLNLLSQELRETESMEVAIDIARRVRTARKVLYGEAMTRQASLMITPSQLQQQLKDQTGLIAAPATVSIVKATGQRTGIAPFNLISGVHSDQGRRRTNEDRHMIIEDIRVCCPSISGSGNWAYFAVYDGHGGACSSKILQDVLHTRIVSHSDFVRNVSTALRCGFEEAEKIILQRGTSEGFKDGSTAAVAIIHDTCLTIANLGDSEIVLARHGEGDQVEVVVLSHKHRADAPEEKERIEKLGGSVFNGRVFGMLAVARSFGDSDFKIPTSECNYVSAEPFIQSVELTNKDWFVVLACDGVWDKMSHEQVVEEVSNQLRSGSTAQSAASKLVDTAIAKGSADNVTALVVQLAWT